MYWRLSGFYLFHFASLGILVPYWSLYLGHLGFDPLQIGELMALLMATKIISPNIWGWIADRTGQRLWIVRIGTVLGFLSFLFVFQVQGYWGMALLMAAFSFFWNAVLPQFEANTLQLLGTQLQRYSSIRLWGSIGFIITVAGMGPLLDIFSVDVIPQAMLAIFFGIMLASFLAPNQGGVEAAPANQSLWQVLRRPQVIALLLVCLLMQASHGPYYTFYTLYMEQHGYSRGAIGQLWALGVMAEVLLFMLMPRLLAKHALESLLMFSVLLTALRWLLIACFPHLLPVVLFAQTLHAASFGMYHATAIALFHHYFSHHLQGRGQAIYASFSFGVGGAAGSYYSGAVWQIFSPEVMFLIASALCGIALLTGWRGLRPG